MSSNKSVNVDRSFDAENLISNRYRVEKRLNKNDKSTIYLVCDTKNDSL